MKSLQPYLKFPFEIKPLDSDLNDELMRYFHGMLVKYDHFYNE